MGVGYMLYKRLESESSKEQEGLREGINILTASLEKKNKIVDYLPSKQKKASSLVDLSQELVELDDPEDIYNFLISAAEQLFPGFCYIVLFEFDRRLHQLNLVRSSKKEDLVVKEKQGGGIDRWMLRQNSSLLVGDIRRDFRFDASQIDAFNQRGSISFLASPLSVGDKFFGIIRIESSRDNFFSHEDLRLLSNISDLGAVVLERARLIKQVEDLAATDSLTGLSLRNYFNEKIKSEIERARESKTKFALAMLDIDDFKQINDTHGHVVGDLVLKRLARALEELELDARITACRYGGEEFMLLFAETSKDESFKLLKALKEKVSGLTVAYRRNKVKFTISLGFVLYPDDRSGLDELIEGADQLMYKAKKQGKNKICYLP